MLPSSTRLTAHDTPLILGPTSSNATLETLEELLSFNRAEVRRLLDAHGAILFRGFGVHDASRLERASAAFSPNSWVEYREAATPRDAVEGHVSTSTTYLHTEVMQQHNENSHVMSWPLYLMFCCETAAATGGATPLADVRKVYERIPADLRSRLMDEGVLYRRAFGFNKRMGFTWKKTFDDRSKEALDAYFRENFIRGEWDPKNPDKLVTTYRRWAMLKHALTGEPLWFNHGTFFNFYGLPKSQQEMVTSIVGVEGAPYHTFFGGGGALSQADYHALRAAYDEARVSIPWERGDFLLIDNMLTTHGREPYEGARRVLVTMTDRIDAPSVAQPETYAIPTIAPRVADIVVD